MKRTTEPELCSLLSITPAKLATWIDRGLPCRRTKGAASFDLLAVRDWLVSKGLDKKLGVASSVAGVANHFKVHDRAVSRWMRNGMPVAASTPGKRGGVYVLPMIAAWLETQGLSRASQGDAPLSPGLRAVREAQAELMEFKCLIAEGGWALNEKLHSTDMEIGAAIQAVWRQLQINHDQGRHAIGAIINPEIEVWDAQCRVALNEEAEAKEPTVESSAPPSDSIERLRFARARRLRNELRKLQEQWVDVEEWLSVVVPLQMQMFQRIADRLDAEIEPRAGEIVRDLAEQIQRINKFQLEPLRKEKPHGKETTHHGQLETDKPPRSPP